MRPEDRVRLRHLREAATKAIDYSATRNRSDLDDDEPRLIHHYFDINLDILRQTITEDLPHLLAALPTDIGDDSLPS